MRADILLECVFVLNPRTAARARRLAVAMTLLREGKSRREVCVVIRQRFGVIQQEAWRLVDLAADMAGPTK